MSVGFGKEIMLEKRFIAVPPQLFTANGGADGSLKVVYSGFFKVKQKIIISATSQINQELEIKRITDINTIYVGPVGPIDKRTDISAFTVAAGAAIFANEQVRPSIPFEESTRAVYEEEPVVAYRVIPVDQNGNTINVSEDGLVPQEFDDVILTRDLDEDIIEAQFYLRATEVRDLELTYNIAKSLIRVRKVGP